MKLGFKLVPLLALNPRLASDVSMSADGEKATAEPSGSVFAFHKPPGLTIEMGSAATGGAGGRKKTLNDYLAEMRPPRPDGPRLAPIGRLDKATRASSSPTTACSTRRSLDAAPSRCTRRR